MEELLCQFESISGSRYVFTDAEALYPYGRDQTDGLHFSFDMLVKPGSVEEIAAIMKVCNQRRIPVTPRGGGSGVTGGALPCMGGVVLSLERLNRIIGINSIDGYVVAESGVVTADLCKAVAREGLCFPVAPSSSAYSFIGGNVAENAGSINSCKYGVTGSYVLNMEVVLPSGEVIWTGANVPKNATGLDLTHLFVGSEGILGVITKIVYRLIPPADREAAFLVAFTRLEDAYAALLAIKKSVLFPSAAELICRNAFDLLSAHSGDPLKGLSEGKEAFLLIELQDFSEARLNESKLLLMDILEGHPLEQILMAETGAERQRLRKIRSGIGDALTAGANPYRDIDVCVPLSSLYRYIRKVEQIAARYKIPMVCFGHALDGNLHTMLLLEKKGDPSGRNREEAIREIYADAIASGGVISGEHGIGLLQKQFLKLQFPATQLALMKQLKELFDPNLILNPGKIFQ